MTIGNLAFCLALYLTGVHFRGELQHGDDVSKEKIKCRPIRTREIGGARLSEELYARSYSHKQKKMATKNKSAPKETTVLNT